MSSSFVKWFANGVIAVVILSTLWLAQSMSAHQPDVAVMVAQAALPADAASAPTPTRR